MLGPDGRHHRVDVALEVAVGLLADLFEADFSEATVVTLFLYPDVNLRLRPKLLAELEPGTRVVSYWHDMGDWKPERIDSAPRASIYLWRIPERAGE